VSVNRQPIHNLGFITSESPIQLVRTSFPERPAYDTAVSRAILERVAAGELPETIRLARPGAMLAFGRQDLHSPGYARAVQAARSQGFAAVERLAGGRAAVFHEQTIAFAWARAERDPWPGTHDRFREIAGIVERALARLGVEARIGEIPGEYCAGEYSINARGEKKLVGIGQRIIKGASHIGGVIVVAGAERVRDVLIPVYEALGLQWDRRTAGSVEDELGQVAWDDVAEVVLGEWSRGRHLVEAELDPETLELAERLEIEHVSPR
jgi:octanoyl-[GcvH]:protein N-octanoyltransferase